MNTEQKTKFPEPFYYLIFQINATNNTELRSLFTDVKSFFESFPVLRWAGWDLHLGAGARYVIDLEGIEHIDSTKRIRISEKGGVIIQGALNSNFFCWGGGEAWGESTASSRIHSLALIEFTYSSLRALQEIIKYVDNPTIVKSEIGFSGINNEFYLRYNKIGTGFIPFEKNFADRGSDFELDISINDLSDENLPITVYKIMEKIYRMFGLDGDKIPYTKEVLSKKMIDTEQIKDTK